MVVQGAVVMELLMLAAVDEGEVMEADVVVIRVRECLGSSNIFKLAWDFIMITKTIVPLTRNAK